MSESVMYTGKLKELEFDATNNLEDKIKTILTDEQKEDCVNNYSGDFVDYFYDNDFYNKYVIVGDKLYEIISYSGGEYTDVFQANKNEDETINFVVAYYNGGCSFGEAIEEAINNMDKGE